MLCWPDAKTLPEHGNKISEGWPEKPGNIEKKLRPWGALGGAGLQLARIRSPGSLKSNFRVKFGILWKKTNKSFSSKSDIGQGKQGFRPG
jgi:hypothetical protein